VAFFVVDKYQNFEGTCRHSFRVGLYNLQMTAVVCSEPQGHVMAQWLVVFSPRTTDFDSRPVHIGFVGDKWNLKVLCFQYTSFSLASIFPSSIRTYAIIATDSVVTLDAYRIMSQKTFTLVLAVRRSQIQTSPALQEHFHFLGHATNHRITKRTVTCRHVQLN